MTQTKLLDCGHSISAHSGITSGYGTDRDGKRLCYACCHARELQSMRDGDRIGAYLSSDGKTITTWTGETLAHVTREWETSAGGFARRTQITRIWAKDATGQWWYGRGPGRGMYTRLRKAKTRITAWRKGSNNA